MIILLPSLTKLVNCSLIEGCIPDAFKTAVVTPLIKKANLSSDDLKNYHPVSGLSFISRLVEHVVAKQLLEHIHVHNLDNPYQSAYKAGHSTEIALLSIKNEVHLSLSRGKPTALVLFWGLLIPYIIPLFSVASISGCGIRGSVLIWFTSYLADLVLLCQMFVNSYLASPKVLLGPLSFVVLIVHPPPPSLIISKHKGIKFHFYSVTAKFIYIYPRRIHLLPLNSSTGS